jgi:hypothetical protein
VFGFSNALVFAVTVSAWRIVMASRKQTFARQ